MGSAGIATYGPNVGSILNQWTYSYKDVATKVLGPHTLKFGGELTRLYYLNNCVGCGVPSYEFYDIWDFLNDAPHSESGGFDPHTGVPTTIRQDDRQNIWGVFAQDDWKVRRNLTLSLGLRWSYFGPLSAKQGNMYRAFPGRGPGFLTDLYVEKSNSWDAQNHNFGPSVGFAWSPSRFNDKLVVRGGYGLSYSQFEIALSANIQGNPGLIVWPSLTNQQGNIVYATAADVHSYVYPANPYTISAFSPNGLPATGNTGVSIFPQEMPTMRVHHYSLDTQYEFARGWIASLGYQGSLSRHIYFHQSPLAMAAESNYVIPSSIGWGDNWGVNGYGNYNALLAEARHQFSQGFLLDAQFTWAKSMDTGSGPYVEQPYPNSPSLNYGLSDYDVNKAFKIFGSYSPTFFRGSKTLVKSLADGWTISGIFNYHTGFPWTPAAFLGGNMYCGGCWGFDHLPGIYLGGAGSSTSNDAYKTGSNYPMGGAHYYGTPATDAVFGYGTTDYGVSNPQIAGGRNSVRGPNYRSVDATLVKAFALPNTPVLGEDAKFEFRIDAYNLFNNLNLLGGSQTNENGHIVNNIALPSFGTSTGSYSGRVVTLGARFEF
jgi:hypothetical protein